MREISDAEDDRFLTDWCEDESEYGWGQRESYHRIVCGALVVLSAAAIWTVLWLVR